MGKPALVFDLKRKDKALKSSTMERGRMDLLHKVFEGTLLSSCKSKEKNEIYA